MTLQSQIVDTLLIMGEEKLVVQPSRKYITLTCKAHNCYYYVGKSGALRRGPNIVSSFSLTGSKFYKDLLK